MVTTVPETSRIEPPVDMKAKMSTGSASTFISSISSPLNMPRRITETSGGEDLWVRAPEFQGWLAKKGFRWRRRWKMRWVSLNGRQLSYFASSAPNSPSRGTATITPSAQIENGPGLAFTFYPSKSSEAWQFHACSKREKQQWMLQLINIIDFLNWLKHFNIGKTLGTGASGIVCELRDRRDSSLYAVKVIDAKRQSARKAAMIEIETLTRANDIEHPNIVHMNKVYEEAGKIYIMMEHCSGGELFDLISVHGRRTEQQAAFIMKQVLSALSSLHENNILHLDIKPENILFASNAENSPIKLTDFGLARISVPETHEQVVRRRRGKPLGTVGYMAPEVIKSCHYSAAADVFSAGVVFYILLAGYPPFYGRNDLQIFDKILDGDFNFRRPEWFGVSDHVKDLISGMLATDPKKRITIEQILNHSWMLSATEN